MKTTTPSEPVKYRTVSILVYPFTHRSGNEWFRFKKKDGKTVSRSTLEKAKKAAKEYAVSLFRGGIDMNNLTDEQVAVCQRFLSVNPTMKQVDEFLVWQQRANPRKNAKEAVAEFLAQKKVNTEDLNYETLRKHLKHIPDMDLCDITVSDFPALKGAARTRNNRRAAWITFFKWCVMDRAYLTVPHGETKTAAQKLSRAIVKKKTPVTWLPDQMRVLLENARRMYLPWLVLTSFNGLRTEEVQPQHGSVKSPLDWADFNWEDRIIVVRPETSKTNQQRIIPICDVTYSWLYPMRQTAGRVGPQTHPAKPTTSGATCETTRLGQLVGGWKRNANRHSFVSYRAAQAESLAVAAKEAGNTEAESKSSYDASKSKAEGNEWFALVKPGVTQRSPKKLKS